jgi:group I intron endonuclease
LIITRDFYINNEICYFLSVVPVVSYANADTCKPQIIQEIKGKSGIYRWINNTSGKSYVGSSVHLSARLYRYYSLAHITAQAKHSLICKALLKHGYSNFSFEILEYCNKGEVLVREQYYLDLLKPDYNILLKAVKKKRKKKLK